MSKESLANAYKKVFDARGNVRACGRESCINLIEECEKIEKHTYFGDSKTGRMNMEAIKKLVLK